MTPAQARRRRSRRQTRRLLTSRCSVPLRSYSILRVSRRGHWFPRLPSHQPGKNVLLIQISRPNRATPSARLQPISFFSTGSKGSYSIVLSSSEILGSSSIVTFPRASSRGQRRCHPVEKQPGNQQTDPNDETEQADQIHGRQSADAFFAEFPEVRDHADGKEGEDKKQHTENVRSSGNRPGGSGPRGG